MRYRPPDHNPPFDTSGLLTKSEVDRMLDTIAQYGYLTAYKIRSQNRTVFRFLVDTDVISTRYDRVWLAQDWQRKADDAWMEHLL